MEKEIFEQLMAGTSDLNLQRKYMQGKLKNVEEALLNGTINEGLNVSLKPELSINAVSNEEEQKKRKVALIPKWHTTVEVSGWLTNSGRCLLM